LGESGWDSKLLAARRSLGGHAVAGRPCDELPEIASLLLTNFVERGEVQPRRFSTGP
jgi:two-component system nitrogen regulation response regulator NtrX